MILNSTLSKVGYIFIPNIHIYRRVDKQITLSISIAGVIDQIIGRASPHMVLRNFRYQYLQTEVEVALLIISATAFVVLANPSNVTLQVRLLLQSSSNLSDRLSIVISFGTCCAGGTSHQKLSANLLRLPKLE